MNAKQFWAVVALVVVMTIGVAILGERMRRWGPHSTSLNLRQEAGTATYGVDKTMPGLELADLNGDTHSLKAARGKIIVLLVQGNKCPCSEAYVSRVNAIYRDYSPRGVEVWAFNPNIRETAAQTKRFVTEHKVAYPTAYDTRGKVADILGAACTTETWVVDREGFMRYHGRIDDNIFEPKKVTTHDLRNALDDVLAGRPVKAPETRAYACTIQREETP
jgi:peroxiredoxin